MKDMRYLLLSLIPLTAAAAPTESRQTTLKAGAGIYRSCYYCHSLQPGVHLTGPSLAHLWNQKSGQVEGFELYSAAMAKSQLTWDEATLRKWLRKPEHLLPGTSMIYEGPKDEASMHRLIEFLKIALSLGGYKKVQSLGLLDAEVAGGQLPKDASQLAKEKQVKEALHCGNTITVTTADGKRTKLWEANLSFQVRAGKRGPPPGSPGLVPTGSMGDRFTIVFRHVRDLERVVKSCEQKKAQP
jgi:cytochrome c